ncbi:fibronectin type III domain-containing protein [Enterococcus sp. N249-2]
MAIYGMKDAANLIMVSKKTKQPAMYIDYANATSSEWSSESVYATKKGANAIRWDGSRNGTLTLETEMFDFGLLAMVMGSDIKEGRSDIFTRVEATLDSTRQVKIGEAVSVDGESISILKLKDDKVEHDGLPLYNESSAKINLPGQVKDVTVAVNDTTAKINFPKATTATSYQITRDNEVIAEVSATEFVDTGLTAEKEYTYTVVSVNEYGKGAASAKVIPTTSASGVTALTQFVATAQAKIDAVSNTGMVNPPETGAVTFSYSDGIVEFNEQAVPGDSYAIYFMNTTENVRTLTIDANKFADSYEIFADSQIREQDTSNDILVQMHYFNAKPQSNFTLTQSSTEPTSLSIVFDLMPVGDKLAEFKAIG